MTYQWISQQPMSVVERLLNQIVHKSPNIPRRFKIASLDCVLSAMQSIHGNYNI